MRSFIQDFNLNFHFFRSFSVRCMGVAVSVDKHWLYQHKLLGPKSTDFTWCIFQKNSWIWTVQSDLLIPEQILLDITLIKVDNVSYLTYWLSGLMGWKCVDSKFFPTFVLGDSWNYICCPFFFHPLLNISQHIFY